MITIIHGANIAESRKALTKKKEAFPPEAVTTITGHNLEKVAQAGGAAAMFNSKRLIVLEREEKWTKSFSQDLMDQLKYIDPKNHIIIWHNKKIPASDKLLKLTKKKGDVLYFKDQQTGKEIFTFLDTLGNRNKTSAYLQLRKMLENGEHPIYLLNRIIGLFRKMMAVKWGAKKLIPSHPYARKKISSQSENFTEQELLDIYQKLEDADITMKTGGDPVLTLQILIEKVC